MADTTFVDQTTVIEASWLNDVNDAVYKQIADHDGADDFGTTSTASATLTAYAAARPSGGKIHLKGGSWTLESAFTTSVQRLHILGVGEKVTNFVFTPGATAAAITFDAGGGGGYNEGSIKGVGFNSADSSDKTAIKLVNAANCEVENIAISTGSWLGDSTALRTEGRQLVRVRKLKAACARPVVFGKNTFFSTLATDHFTLRDSELVGTSATRPVIEIEDGANFSNFHVHDTAIVGGQGGIKWVDTTSTAAGFQFLLTNARFEQTLDTTSYCLELNSTAQTLQSVNLRDVRLDSTCNGIKLRNCQRVVLESVDFAGGAGKTSLDMTFVAGSQLVMINCFGQASSTITLTNARLVRRVKNNTIGMIEEWVFDSGAVQTAHQFGVPLTGPLISVATTATSVVCDNTFSGLVMITHSSRASALFMVTGTTGTTSLVAEFPASRYSTTALTASRTNLYYNGASLTLENRDGGGGTLVYSILLFGYPAGA